LEDLSKSKGGLDEYKEYISQLIEFIYSEIEKQRRRALATMIEVARKAQNNHEIKEYILNYFEESTFTKDLMKLQKEFNIERINEIAGKIEAEKNIDRLKNLYGNIQRFLESAPDNPAFYLLSTLDRVKIKVEMNKKWVCSATVRRRCSARTDTSSVIGKTSSQKSTNIDTKTSYSPC